MTIQLIDNSKTIMLGEHDSLKQEENQIEQNPKMVIAETKPNIPKVRHVYLEEENIYGRFVPYLLLKDQLHSEIDSSGNSALHHMCSHNSAYLPLYLSTIKQGDPILNRKSNMGHTPLDVAGLYCNKQYVQMIKNKGAADNGQVDHWAIQGGNLTNWSGQVDPKKKFLIHWAAYNDLPEVIAEFGRQGVNLSQPDSNGYKPIDLAIINKSYKTAKVLSELGERPQAEILKSTDSKSLQNMFQKLAESDSRKSFKMILKLLTIPFFLSLCNYLSQTTTVCITSLICTLVWLYLLLTKTNPERYMDGNRRTAFVSQLLLNKEINRTNHFSYLLLHFSLICCCLQSIISGEIVTHLDALICWVLIFVGTSYLIHLIVQIHGIMKNLTYSEMFYAHEWSHLWREISFIPEREMVIRKFTNRYDEGWVVNLCSYF